MIGLILIENEAFVDKLEKISAADEFLEANFVYLGLNCPLTFKRAHAEQKSSLMEYL